MPSFKAAGLQRWISALACVGIVFLFGFGLRTLTAEPCVGVADNLDYWRVMRPAGIRHVEPLEQPGVFVRCIFEVEEADFTTLASSSALLAWLAKGFSTSVDLQQLGVLYLVLLGALWITGLLAGLSPLLLLALCWVFFDPGYFLFFNSFYAEPTLFLALSGLVIWLMRWGAKPWDLWSLDRVRRIAWIGLLLGLTAMGGGSKMQFVPLPAVVLGALAVPFIRARRRPTRNTIIAAVLLLSLAVAIPWHFFRGTGARFPEANNYHAVYAGILKVSQDPQSVLQALGIPTEYWDLPRRDIFSTRVSSEHPVHESLANLSRARLASLYLADPSAIGSTLTIVRNKLTLPAPHTRGNFPRIESGDRKQRFSVPWQFSRLRARLLRPWPTSIWFVSGIGVIWIGWLLWKNELTPAAVTVLFLLAWMFTQIAVSVLGDGFVALEQHLLSARLAFDFALCVLIYGLVETTS